MEWGKLRRKMIGIQVMQDQDCEGGRAWSTYWEGCALLNGRSLGTGAQMVRPDEQRMCQDVDTLRCREIRTSLCSQWRGAIIEGIFLNWS